MGGGHDHGHDHDHGHGHGGEGHSHGFADLLGGALIITGIVVFLMIDKVSLLAFGLCCTQFFRSAMPQDRPWTL